jgi:hypothetical protein
MGYAVDRSCLGASWNTLGTQNQVRHPGLPWVGVVHHEPPLRPKHEEIEAVMSEKVKLEIFTDYV